MMSLELGYAGHVSAEVKISLAREGGASGADEAKDGGRRVCGRGNGGA
jgi:hypothetical protein